MLIICFINLFIVIGNHCNIFTLSDQLKKQLPIHMNLLGIWTNYYLSYSTSIIWIPQRNFTNPLGKLRENSSAQSQNILASGYWKLLSLHAFLVTWMKSYFITVHFNFSLFFNTCIKRLKWWMIYKPMDHLKNPQSQDTHHL